MKHQNTTELLARMTGMEPLVVARFVGPLLASSPEYRAHADLLHDPLAGPAVRWCLLHGLTEATISDLLDLPHKRVARHARSGLAPSVQAVHAVTLARAGWSATEINNHLGLTGRGWVYRTLRHAGVSPKALGRRAATTPEQRAAAVALYEAGHTYKDIAEATGLSHANVANVLRAAHKRGDLPEYGRRLQRTAS